LEAPVTSQWVGPAVSVAAVLLGVATGWAIKSPGSAGLAGGVWLIGLGMLIAGLASGLRRRGSWAVALLLGYAVVVLFVQSSLRTDGQAEEAVIASALWLIPAAAGGVALPRTGQWAAAAGCWYLLLALSTAASANVWHRNSSVALFTVILD
jgi:hypothetical protein